MKPSSLSRLPGSLLHRSHSRRLIRPVHSIDYLCRGWCSELSIIQSLLNTMETFNKSIIVNYEKIFNQTNCNLKLWFTNNNLCGHLNIKRY